MTPPARSAAAARRKANGLMARSPPLFRRSLFLGARRWLLGLGGFRCGFGCGCRRFLWRSLFGRFFLRRLWRILLRQQRLALGLRQRFGFLAARDAGLAGAVGDVGTEAALDDLDLGSVES